MPSRHVLKLEVGYLSTQFAEPDADNPAKHTHRWTVFVQSGISGVPLEQFVESVQFSQHESFDKPTCVVSMPPFSVNETGNAAFTVSFVVVLKYCKKALKFSYNIGLKYVPTDEQKSTLSFAVADIGPELSAILAETEAVSPPRHSCVLNCNADAIVTQAYSKPVFTVNDLLRQAFENSGKTDNSAAVVRGEEPGSSIANRIPDQEGSSEVAAVASDFGHARFGALQSAKQTEKSLAIKDALRTAKQARWMQRSFRGRNPRWQGQRMKERRGAYESAEASLLDSVHGYIASKKARIKCLETALNDTEERNDALCADLKKLTAEAVMSSERICELEAELSRERKDKAMLYCRYILDKLSSHEHAWPFAKPVDAVALNLDDYHDIIKQPMDLSTMKHKLDNLEYENPEDFAADFRLMIANCRTYNQPDPNAPEHPVVTMASQLQTEFERLLSEMPVPHSIRGTSGAVAHRDGNQASPTVSAPGAAHNAHINAGPIPTAAISDFSGGGNDVAHGVDLSNEQSDQRCSAGGTPSCQMECR